MSGKQARKVRKAFAEAQARANGEYELSYQRFKDVMGMLRRNGYEKARRKKWGC